MRVSLGRRAVTDRARIWGKAAREADRTAERTKKGVILEAIVSGVVSVGGAATATGFGGGWVVEVVKLVGRRQIVVDVVAGGLELLAKCAAVIGLLG